MSAAPAGFGAALSPAALGARLLYPIAERVEARRIRPKLAALRAEAAEPPEQRRRRQAERLAAVARQAGHHVPYYRDLFAKHGFEPERLADDPRRIEALPHLGRDALVEAGPRLLDERLDPARLVERRTGGSTGAAARIFYSREALDWTAAVNLFARERAGHRPFAGEAHLSTAPGIEIPWRDRLREAVKCASLNRTNLPIEGYDPATLDDLWRKLERTRPALVQGHPSTLHALARHVAERGGCARPLFGVFESTGETLDPGVRKTVGDVLGCRVVDRYGSAEFGVVAYEEPGGRPGMALLESVVFAETLPAANGDEAAANGDEELVLTGLLNPAMPLLRYRTGDLARLAREPDEVAGRIVAVQGRVHDAVPLGGREVPTHVLQDRLDRLACVEEFQVELHDSGPPRLRVAAPEGEHARIRESVRSWWGSDLALEFTTREGFVRTGWRGKFRHVVDRRGAGAGEPG